MNWSRKEIELAIELGGIEMQQSGPEAGSWSGNLRLSFPYDWPEADMPESLFIKRVVAGARFEDIVIIAMFFGMNTVKEAAQRRYPAGLPEKLARVIKNIEAGVAAERSRSDTQ